VVIIYAILLWWLISLQTFSCPTAFSHVHDQIREGQIQITAWSGCAVTGVINNVNVQLWADSSTCPLRSKVPGVFQIRWDATCKQVIDLSDGPLPPYCPPSPSPTPLPTPTATLTLIPSPSPTPSPTSTSKRCKAWPPWKLLNCL